MSGTTDTPPELTNARSDAGEFGLVVPDEITGSLLSTLAAGAVASDSAGAIAVTPAAGVVGLYLLEGLGERGHLTCIDPEAEHQKQARATFTAAGYRPSRFRFLPSRPLEVMGRLAHGSYQLVYGDMRPSDLKAFITAAWPLLSDNGVLILADCLLDGTLSDDTRRDRDTIAAREADEHVRQMDGALVTRLPLGAGMTILTKRPAPSS
ncbi:class I SAM-dependent methyltransferase [Corynebacterium sp. CCM 9185]|nr:class I SAM-dependent methyltransferase [Corynebacterium marambiense]MCK7663492.1 class I SAM-dependent methyltransferase [Corynebacterium marambiense]MCX7542074.1 class I SAM-dependent methyltransferase [Corynebacterium marambiense]